MKRILKITLLVLLVVFLLIQFYPRARKNNNPSMSNDISAVHFIPANVKSLLKSSCYDCHSNYTNYPWYYNLQPVAWWLDDHIKEAKKELNFSEFAQYNIARQYRKLEEINELVTENEMPLKAYTIIHTDTKLNEAKKLLITGWATNLYDSFKNSYPADSLIRKKK